MLELLTHLNEYLQVSGGWVRVWPHCRQSGLSLSLRPDLPGLQVSLMFRTFFFKSKTDFEICRCLAPGCECDLDSPNPNELCPADYECSEQCKCLPQGKQTNLQDSLQTLNSSVQDTHHICSWTRLARFHSYNNLIFSKVVIVIQMLQIQTPSVHSINTAKTARKGIF